MIRIAVLISGGGTTLRNLIEVDRRGGLDAEICLVISSRRDADGLKFSRDADIETLALSHRDFKGNGLSLRIFEECRAREIELVVLGGFLRKLEIPADFENRVINIHPSLIPAFSGRGYYGARVHEAVLEYGTKLSGCTVHFVDNEFDHGPIIAQRAVPVYPDDSPARLAERVFAEECRVYPEAVNWISANRVAVAGRTVTIAPPPGSD